jgi:ABC-type dipeptide/oligopeptide/nickel transport system permease subunit
MRLTDGMFAFPDILLAILVIGALDRGFIPVIVALSVSGWPAMARLTRNQLVSLKEREFVVAAKAAGASTPYLIFKHLLPQMSGILLAVTMIDLAGSILAESTLSFLGIGVQTPTPSWGGMINNARLQMNSNPLELLPPCAILSLTVFSLNFIGDGLRNYFDPNSSNI